MDFLRAAPSKELWLHRFGVAAPHAFLRRVATLRARSATYAPAAYANFFLRSPAFARTHPTNAALLVCLAFVAAGVALVFLLIWGPCISHN